MWAWRWAVVAWASFMGTSAWSRDTGNHNFATTHRRSPDWTYTSPKNVRRTLLRRMWEDSAPDPLHLATVPPSPGPPQLSANSLLLGEDDYEDAPSELWLGQSAVHPQREHGDSTSLEGLQHLLEGEVSPRVQQVGTQGGAGQKEEEEEMDEQVEEEEEEGGRGVSFSEPHVSQHRGFAEDLDMFPRGGVRQESPDTSLGEQHQSLLPSTYQQRSIGSPNTISREVLRDLLTQHAMDPLSQRGQFSGEYLGHSPLMDTADMSQMPPHLLPADQYPESLSEVFLQDLLDEELMNTNSQTDLMDRVGAPDYPDHAAIPDMLSSHQGFGEFMHHSYAAPSHAEQGLQHPAGEGVGSGPGWLPSTLSRLNLPSAEDMIAHLTDRYVAPSEACHARHLHTCGGRVIEEFSHEPDFADTCRIREEFLDCMEKEQKEPCRLEGMQFTKEGTRRIIRRIKKLLWSSRGCILGHSP